MINKRYLHKIWACPILCVFMLLFVACNGGNCRNRDSCKLKSADDFECGQCTDCGELKTGEVIQKYVSDDGRIVIEIVSYSCGGDSTKLLARWIIRDDKGRKHVIRSPKSTLYCGIHAVVKNDGSVYYIVNSFCRGSNRNDGIGYLEAYKIVGDSVREVNVMNGGTKIDNKDFELEYYFPNWYWITHGAGYAWIFKYDFANNNLYVPIVVNRNICDRYHVWHFNGDRFVYIGERPHLNLHKSLCKYESLACYLPTEDYIVRVDSLYNRELRFASWKKPKTMSDKPDVLIKGGKRMRHTGVDGKKCLRDDFYFSHGEYEYFIVYCKESHIKGWDGIPHYDLIVKKNGEVIIQQELDD